jgi:hypothetical protein
MSQEPADTARLFVPLQDAACGVSLRLFRDRDGSRCAIGFTTTERLAGVLGPQQRYYRLTERSVRTLARERGVDALIVDPGLVAPAVSPVPADHAVMPNPLVPNPLVPEPLVPERLLRERRGRRGRSRSPWHPEVAGLLAVGAVTGAAAPELDLGGGHAVAYRPGEQDLDPATFADAVRRRLAERCAAHRIAVSRLAIEPGRAIVGPAGVALHRVLAVKHPAVGPPFVAVDGGMSDDPRPSLYGAH